ncbi:hypothetical protein BC834DRAFT_897969 [Gloeopeniophorella convolvens]|nr:hypothetical protein BC834DRAFT_897969 [Gloeopeniophorella convolvens]
MRPFAASQLSCAARAVRLAATSRPPGIPPRPNDVAQTSLIATRHRQHRLSPVSSSDGCLSNNLRSGPSTRVVLLLHSSLGLQVPRPCQQ